MLDPDSRHELQLDFKQRKPGRPPLSTSAKILAAGPVVPPPIEIDPATLLARAAAERIRHAKKRGSKIPLKQVYDGTSRATFHRRWRQRKPNKTADRSKG